MRCYGHLELTESSPAQSLIEPITLAEAKAFLQIQHNSEDDLIEEALIPGARVVAEYYQRRDLVRKQYDLTLDHFPSWSYEPVAFIPYWIGQEIELRQPLVSVDLVRWRDIDGLYTTLVEDIDYVVDLARALILPVYGKSFPGGPFWPSGGVLVRYTSGLNSTSPFWLDVGRAVKVGMRQLIVHHYTQRLPFEMSNIAAQEYPLTVTDLLSMGAVPSAPR